MKNFVNLFIFLGFWSLVGQVSENQQEYNGCKYLEEPNYIINKTQVYFENCAIHRKVDVRPEALILVGNGLAHDGENIFFNGIKLSVAPDDLEILYNENKNVFWRNKDVLYKNNRKIYQIDSASFKVLQGGYFKDANAVFYLGNEIKEADAKTFVYNDEFSFDANHVYQKGRTVRMNGYLQTVNGHFYKDDIQVYEQDNGYNTEDFVPNETIKIQNTKALPETKYGLINNTLYYLNKPTRLANIALASVRVLNSDLIVYEDIILYKGFVVTGLDASSLSFIKLRYYSAIVKDKSGTFTISIVGSGDQPRKVLVEKTAVQNSEQETPYTYHRKSQLLFVNDILYLNMQPILERKVLEEKGFIDFNAIELVSVLSGYRKGCSLDNTPGSNYYILKNKKGYWEIISSAVNDIAYIGETYQF